MAARTRYNPSELRSWARVKSVQVVSLKYCPQIKRAIGSAINRNGNIKEAEAAGTKAKIISWGGKVA